MAPKDIIKYFKEKHNIDVKGWEVSYLCKAVPMHVAKKAAKPKKVAKKETSRGGTDNDSIENVAQDIVKLLRGIDDGYKKIFMFLRGELIKSRAQVHTMMKGAGIPVEEEGEVEES